MNKYIINEDVLGGILAYLMQRPYVEVHQGISALQSLKRIEEDGEQDKEPS